MFDNKEPEKIEDLPDFPGVCRKCLNSGYVHIVRGNVLGVAKISAGLDSSGREKFKLQVCDHNADHGF